MALPATRFDAEMFMEERVGRLEERVERLQIDVTDIKADVRRMDGKIDALHLEMKDGFAAADRRIAELDTKVTASAGNTATALASLEARLQASIAALDKARIADRVWWLLIAGGILGVMARGFQWL